MGSITFSIDQLEQGIVLGIRDTRLVCDDPTDLLRGRVWSHWERPGLQGAVVFVRNDHSQDRGTGGHR